MSTDRLARVRQVLEEHNSTAATPIDIDGFVAKLSEMGGTTEETRAEATWEDLEQCDLPRILARKVAAIFRGPEPELATTHASSEPIVVNVVDDDPEKAAKRMTPRQLIEAYDPKRTKDPVALRLKELSEGRRFLVPKDGAFDAELSTRLFNELDTHGELEELEVTWSDFPVPVMKVGDRIDETADEHPLRPGKPLRTSDQWHSVPPEVKQIMYLAVSETGELDMDCVTEIDVLREAKDWKFADLCKKYPLAAAQLREQRKVGDGPKLKLVLGQSRKGKGKGGKGNSPWLAQNETS